MIIIILRYLHIHNFNLLKYLNIYAYTLKFFDIKTFTVDISKNIVTHTSYIFTHI